MRGTMGRARAAGLLWPGRGAKFALVRITLVFGFVFLSGGASVALAASTAPMFTADTPPAFQLDVVYGSAYSCGSGCSYNNQIGYAFAANGSPVPTYSVSSGALPTGMHLDPANGLLYGAPTSPSQSYSFSVSASNGVAPDAVAGPFSGTLGPPCPAGGSDGSGATTTTSTNLVAANAVSVAFPDASAVVTEVVGRVIRGGVATVVYDERVPVAISDPQAQALLAAAAKADTDAAPGGSVAAPVLASMATTTSPPVQVGQIVPGPPLAGTPTITSTTYDGPTTIDIGPLQSCTFVVSPGSENIDTLISSPRASATDEEQSTDTTTSVYDVNATLPPVPTNTSRPAIAGIAKAGKQLSCSRGSWTHDPTRFADQWSYDGTPIQGATGDTYNVQSVDQGLTLTCTVTASNAGGASTPAASAGTPVPVPHVARCPAATGKLSGITLGLLRLGMTRAQALHAFAHSSNRGKKYEDFFCLTPRGVRVGIASPKLIKTLAKSERKLAGRVIWASTSSLYYSVRGVRCGATVAAASKVLKLTGPFHIGLNYWYLAPNGASTAVFKVRGGIIEEIGIGDKALTDGHKAQVAFLTSFT
jgi:Putative Ig domain